MSSSHPQDGSHRHVWQLAGPIILSNLSVPLLGMVDTAVVGHLPDPLYLGAVAIGSVLVHFLFWAFGFLRMGTTGLAAHACGAGDGRQLREVLGRGLILAALLATLLLLLRPWLTAAGLALMGAETDLGAEARAYVEVRFWAAPATLANYVFWGWFLGLQDSRVPLIVTLTINGLNALLDVLFVYGLGMTASGVALASVLAEYTGLALALTFARRRLRRMPGTWVPARLCNLHACRALLAVNGDLFLRTVGLLAAFAFFTAQGARFGELILAANAVLLQFQTFMAYGLDGFAHAAEAMVGKAIGAGRREALRRSLATTLQWSAGTALVFTLGYALFGPQLIHLLTGIEAVRVTALHYLPWVIATPLLSVWAFWLDGVFIGATRSRDLRNGMLVSVFLIYLPAWALLGRWGNHGLWAALMAFMAARALALAWFLRRRPLSVAPRPAGGQAAPQSSPEKTS